jgi:diguanylate cyclase (GGDEF)-like protein
MLKNLGLFQKILLSICLLIGILMLTTGYLSVNFQKKSMMELLLKNAMVITKSVGTASLTPILVNNPLEVPGILRQQIEGSLVSYAFVLDKNGTCIAHTDPSRQGTRFSSVQDRVSNWLDGYNDESRNPFKADEFIIQTGDELIDVIYPLRIDEIRGYYGLVNVGIPKDMINRSVSEFTNILFYIFVVAAFLGLVFSSVIAFQATKPLCEMVNAASNMSAGNYDIVMGEPNFREERLLKSALQQMSGTIREQIVSLNETNTMLDRKVYEMQILMSASLKMNSKCYSNEVLEHVLDKAVEGLGLSWASLMIIDEKNSCLVPRIVRGTYVHPQKAARIMLGEGIAGRVLQEKVSVVSNLGFRDPQFLKINEQRESEIKNLICAPLVVNDEAIGVINAVNKRDGDFNSDDERLLNSLASLMARSIENSQLYNLAITDGLTGLFIKRYFEDRLQDIVEQSKRYHLTFSLIYADIDFFKSLNDTYGHVFGDSVIRNVAKYFLREARDNIDLVARIGGEEFAVILPETDKQGAVSFALRVRNVIEQELASSVGLDKTITMSFGVATYGEDGQSSNEMLKAADGALYDSKENGRNRVTGAS